MFLGGGRRFALRRVISVCFGPPALVATLAAAAGRLRHLVYVVAKTVPAVQNGPCRSGFAYRTTEAILRGIVGKCIREKGTAASLSIALGRPRLQRPVISSRWFY